MNWPEVKQIFFGDRYEHNNGKYYKWSGCANCGVYHYRGHKDEISRDDIKNKRALAEIDRYLKEAQP